jgi:hypothetical protein
MRILKVSVKPLPWGEVELLVWAREDDGSLACIIETPRAHDEVKDVIKALGSAANFAAYAPPPSKAARRLDNIPF